MVSVNLTNVSLLVPHVELGDVWQTYQWWKSILTGLLAKFMAGELRLGSHTQLQKATKNPNQANVKTRPYTLIGLNAGIERAFLLTGLTTGALHKVVTSNIAVASKTRFECLAIKLWLRNSTKRKMESFWGRKAAGGRQDIYTSGEKKVRVEWWGWMI